MHWCQPGKELLDGLTVLNHDSACISMGSAMKGIEGAIADIYVESFAAEYYEDGEQDIMDYDSDVQVVGPLFPTQDSVSFDAAQHQRIVPQMGEFVSTWNDTTQTSCTTENTNIGNRAHVDVAQPQHDES